MLVYLCDECHAPLKPEEAGEPGASAEGRTLCRACRTRRSPAPALPAAATAPAFPSPACAGCQVAESQDAVPGGSRGSKSNIFCANCDRVSATPGTRFRCHACRAVVPLQDIRSGFAVTEGEKVFCSTCKRRLAAPSPVVPTAPPSRPAAPAPREASAPAAPPPPMTIPPSPPTPPPAAVPLPIPESPGGEPLQCDFCHRSFTLEDLRTGKAEIRDARVLCPRCVVRMDRSRRGIDFRFAASLGFVLLVFPVAAAALLILAFGGKDTERDKTPGGTNQGAQRSPEAPPGTDPSPGRPGRPSPGNPAAAPGEPAGSPKSPAGGSIRGIPGEDLDQIIRNLREADRAPARPATPPALEGPASGAPEAGEDAASLFASPDPAVRLEAVLRVANDANGGPILLKALEDGDAFVRSLAATSLGKRRDTSAIPSLLGLIRDTDLQVRRSASQALLDLAGVRVKPAEDFSSEEIEQLKKYLEKLQDRKQGK
jgi:hypothetical protein